MASLVWARGILLNRFSHLILGTQSRGLTCWCYKKATTRRITLRIISTLGPHSRGPTFRCHVQATSRRFILRIFSALRLHSRGPTCRCPGWGTFYQITWNNFEVWDPNLEVRLVDVSVGKHLCEKLRIYLDLGTPNWGPTYWCLGWETSLWKT